jgi:hypothetical protein
MSRWTDADSGWTAPEETGPRGERLGAGITGTTTREQADACAAYYARQDLAGAVLNADAALYWARQRGGDCAAEEAALKAAEESLAEHDAALRA